MNRHTILTMHPADFDTACQRLQALCASAGEPDLVVGIERGGGFVARRLFPSAPHVMVTLQRQGTPYKSAGLAHWLLRRLPYAALDLMREFEATLREKHSPRRISSLALDPIAAGAVGSARRILIVDDSVDTGAIMQTIRHAVASYAHPDTSISTAAITVTTSQPLIQPDFALYRNHTLIRFPWSNDYKPCQ